MTADQGVRGGKVIELKKTVDDAINNCPCVQNVFVMSRTGAQVPWQDGRDIKLEEVSFRSMLLQVHILIWLLLLGNGATIY